jgi:WD40 repeat protein
VVEWDVETGQQGRQFKDSSRLWSVAVSRDGKRVLTGDVQGQVRVWDYERGTALLPLVGPSDRVVSVAVSPDSRRALSGSWDRTVRLWDLDTGTQCAGEDGLVRLWDVAEGKTRAQPWPKHHTDWVTSVAFSPDSRTLASTGIDGRLILCDVTTGDKKAEWQLPGRIGAVAFAPDGRHLALANGNGTVYVLRLAEKK